MNQAQQQQPQDQQRPSWTSWAFENVGGMYSDATVASRKLREAAGKGCRIIGGVSVMPLPLGHEICVTVVPIEETALYPLNAHARAFVKGEKALKELKADEAAEMMRWGIGKAIINTLATAVGVEWVQIKELKSAQDYAEVQVWGRYKQADGTYRPITATCDMDYREGSAQLSGKTDLQKTQLRATVRRKAETGAKLRALREAFGIEHGINDDQIDRPFVITRVVFTGKTDDPELRKIFALTISQSQLAATGALFGQIAPSIPLVSGGPAPAQLGPAPAPVAQAQPFAPLDDDETPDDVAPTKDAGPAAPAPLAPQPPLPPPAPGDPAKIYMPGKESGPIAKASEKNLVYWEPKLRRDFDEGFKPEYARKNTVQLLTMRAEMRRRKMPVEPHAELDALDPKAGAAPRQNGEGAPQREPEGARQAPQGERAPSRQQRPPSDRGTQAPRGGDPKEQVWGPDDRGDEREDDGSVPPSREPPL